MSDLIRREDALRVTLAYASSYSAEQAETAINALPAVQPDAREAALREALSAINAKWRSGADTPDEIRGLALAEAAILDLIEGQQP